MRTILILILGLSSVYAFYDQKYEPPDGRVIHGLGQFVNLTFYTEEENWQLVTEYQNSTGYIPVMYSTYAYTDPFADNLDSTSLTDAVTNHTYPYVLLVGISIFDSTSTISDVNIPVQSLLNGELDSQVIKIAQEIKSLGTNPVFVRPAYEFGSGNSGLHNDGDNPDWTAENFILIWKRIYNLFQSEEVTNVAWVWNTVNPQSFNFIDWYPGDAYVDWWGVNYFTTSQMSSSTAFLDSAALHQKPVIICESNPISNGGTTNPVNWNDWFVPYFNQIKNNSIKAFVYISDPWDKSGFFDSWPDSRINSDAFILANYSTELGNPLYIHMDEYLSNPALLDASLPVTLTSFAVEQKPFANMLCWETASELENLGFNIFRAGPSAEEQKIEALNFVKMNRALIPGYGTSSLEHHYMWADSQIQNNSFYWYQLEQIDLSGKKEISKVAKVYRKAAYPSGGNLFQNFPNPFNGSTRVKFYLAEPQYIILSLFDLNGAYIKRILDGKFSEGEHKVRLDTENLASGIYFSQLTGSFGSLTKKMVLIK